MIDLREMLKAGVHFGHKTSRWCPKMRPFIWGARNKVHLIDVSKTAILLEKAGKFIKEVAADGGTFLWIGTKKPAQGFIQDIATSLQMPFVINRWVGGTLSNYDQVKKAITRLLHLRDVVKKASTHYKKKEIVMINKEIARLEKNVGGIIDLEYPPAALIVVDAKKEQAAVKEAARLHIPIIALVDTNTDPEGISIIIPSNDDSPRAIGFILDYLAIQAKEGKKLFEDKKAKARLEQIEAKKQAAAKMAEKIEAQTTPKEHAHPHQEKDKTPQPVKKHQTTAPAPKIQAPSTEHVKAKATPQEPAHKTPQTAKTTTKKVDDPQAKEEQKTVKKESKTPIKASSK